MGTRRQFPWGSREPTPEYRIALVGALGVGKSAITVKFLTKRFIIEYDPTMEDTYSKIMKIDSQSAKVKIMDTFDEVDCSNPERYLKWANAYIVVYSITSRPSFDIAGQYLDLIIEYCRTIGRTKPCALVGNKIDLERYRTVSKANGQELASKSECIFHETSAAEDLESVENLFQEILREVAKTNDRQMAMQPLYISEDKSTSSSTGKTSLRRTKSPKAADIKDPKNAPKRSAPTFKLFNKSFKIFN